MLTTEDIFKVKFDFLSNANRYELRQGNRSTKSIGWSDREGDNRKCKKKEYLHDLIKRN